MDATASERYNGSVELILDLIEGGSAGAWNIFLEVWFNIWWLVTPILFGFIFLEAWLFYIRNLWIDNIEWITLRIRTPRESVKTPKAMEQVFSAAYSTYSHGPRLSEIYWDGFVEPWTSFELAAYSGGVSFYIHAQGKFRALFESTIYAQFPDAEIDLVEDYTELLPKVLPNKTYDVWGSEVVLSKNNAYPIRTWPYWETLTFEEKVDTMASILETMSKLKDGEMIWMQFLIRPTDDEWKKEGEKLKKELVSKEEKKKKKSFLGVVKPGEFLFNLFKAPFKDPEWEEEKKEEKKTAQSLTPGEKIVVEGLENKIGKLGFETVIRWVYVARRDVFTAQTFTAVLSSFRQFNTQNMNSLRLNKPTITIGRQPFKKRRIWLKKRRLYDSYILRRFNARLTKISMFNIEELATMYHFPTTLVAAPGLRRVEAKKGSPPSTLPIEEE